MSHLRIQRFDALENHAWFKRIYKKLSATDRTFCRRWIEERADLPADKFKVETEIMFLDRTEKPVRWLEIMELVGSCA